jgi:hypothetical protein
MLVIPQAQIGWSIDLMMRGAIPSQTVLAVLVAEILVASPGWKTAGRHWWLAGALALAACTGVSEISRAFRFAPVGHGRCSFFKAWDQGFARYPKGSYLAPGKVPAPAWPARQHRASRRTRCVLGRRVAPPDRSLAQRAETTA